MATEAQILANRLLSSIVCHLSSVICHLSSPLYTCRELSTNHLFLCKTNPISKKVK